MPLRQLTDRCWLAASSTLVGVVDPRHLLNVAAAGLKTVPDWSDAKYVGRAGRDVGPSARAEANAATARTPRGRLVAASRPAASPALQRHRAERDQRAESFDHLAFFAGEEIAVVARGLPLYGCLGRHQGVIGWVRNQKAVAGLGARPPAHADVRASGGTWDRIPSGSSGRRRAPGSAHVGRGERGRRWCATPWPRLSARG